MTIGLTWRRTARRIKRSKQTVLAISLDYSDRPTHDLLTLSKCDRRRAVSPVIPRLPFKIYVMRLVGTLSLRASSAALKRAFLACWCPFIETLDMSQLRSLLPSLSHDWKCRSNARLYFRLIKTGRVDRKSTRLNSSHT